MKIGIYHDQTIPTRGGGYVLKQEILQSLGSSNLPQNMELVFFSWEDSESLSKISSNHSKLIYNESKSFRLKLALRGWFSYLSLRSFFKDLLMIFKGKHKHVYFKYLQLSGIDSIRKQKFEQQLKSHKINLFLFLEPWEVFTSYAPYICINWDLAHLQDPFFPEILNSWKYMTEGKLDGLKKAMVIVNGTKTLSKQLHDCTGIPYERMRVIPFPTPTDALNFENNLVKLNFFFNLENYLFYPASYWPHKNHVILLKALKELSALKRVNYDLVFCGQDKGNKDFLLGEVKKFKLEDKVHFFDFLTRDQILQLYHNAAALVFPSLIGPDNIPPLEAFALGCPVIASKLSGSLEQLGDAAYLFDPHNIQDLIAGIISLNEDSAEWKVRVSLGKQRAHSWNKEKYADSLVSVFSEIRPFSECCDISTFTQKS